MTGFRGAAYPYAPWESLWRSAGSVRRLMEWCPAGGMSTSPPPS